ncbi:MAG TPA: hypothetical protein VGG39_03510 [Polyangiaceae bacterium]
MADVEADLLLALRAIAGVDGGTDFRIRDGEVSFGVHYVGGSASRLTLEASYDAVAHADAAPGTREAGYRSSARAGTLAAVRPMSIVLRAEDASDRVAKAEGISREHQTGDEAFDAAVYVESPTTDEGVLAAVLNETVRAAARNLLTLAFDAITVDDGEGRVTGSISGFRHLVDAEDAARRMVRAFATLLRGLPPIRVGAGRHPRRSALPASLAFGGFLVAVVLGPVALMGIAGANDCTESASDGEGVTLKDGCGVTFWTATLLACIAAFVAYFVARALARLRMSGHSDSHKRILHVGLAAFWWGGFATFVVSLAIGYGMR